MDKDTVLLIVFIIGAAINGLAMFEAFKLKKNFNILYSRRLRKSIKKDIDTVVLAKRISYIYWLQNFGIFVMLVFIGLFILL